MYFRVMWKYVKDGISFLKFFFVKLLWYDMRVGIFFFCDKICFRMWDMWCWFKKISSDFLGELLDVVCVYGKELLGSLIF